MAFFKLIRKKYPQHEKLRDEDILKSNTTEEDMLVDTNVGEIDKRFKLKYLGCTNVDSLSENVRIKAIDNIFKTAKEGKYKNFQTVLLKVSSNGITVTDSQGYDILKISIYSISNCSHNGTQRQIFSFVCSDLNDILTCHVFLCPKQKIARNVTLAVGNAFNTAYQTWSEFSFPDEEIRKRTIQGKSIEQKQNQSSNCQSENGESLIDLGNDVLNEKIVINQNRNKTKNNWVIFDEVAAYSSFCDDKFQ